MAETQNVEYKESWRDEYLKWICGFANAQGGKIYIGRNDDGEVVRGKGRQAAYGGYPEQNPRRHGDYRRRQPTGKERASLYRN